MPAEVSARDDYAATTARVVLVVEFGYDDDELLNLGAAVDVGISDADLERVADSDLETGSDSVRNFEGLNMLFSAVFNSFVSAREENML